jgi:hypothetical protein
MFVYLLKQQQVILTEQLPYMNLTKIQKSKIVTICVQVLKEKKTYYSLPKVSILNYTCIMHKLKTWFMG